MDQQKIDELIRLNKRLVQQNNALLHIITTYITAPEAVRNSVIHKLAEANEKNMKSNGETLLPN